MYKINWFLVVLHKCYELGDFTSAHHSKLFIISKNFLWSLRTPPFSSDEESEEEDTDMEEEQPQKHQRGKSPQPRLSQGNLVQIRASKASPVQTKHAPARHSFSSNLQRARGPGGGVTKTAVAKIESDDDDEWSEVSELQEIDPRQLQSHRDQNGNVDKRSLGKGKLSSPNCQLMPYIQIIWLYLFSTNQDKHSKHDI